MPYRHNFLVDVWGECHKSHQCIGDMEMGPQLKVSSERSEEQGQTCKPWIASLVHKLDS